MWARAAPRTDPSVRDYRTGVEIEIRRARRAEIMLQLATFPEAPLRSRTVGFPESGSGLGSVPISQGAPSPTARNCGAGAPFAPTRWSLHRPFATTQAPRNPAQSPERTQLSWPPSAQSPFARSGRYPRRSGLASRLEGRYPLVVARTGSCARPSPSPRLGYTRCARSLCRFSPVPAARWPFPTLSPRSLRRRSDLYPAALPSCTCPLLRQGHRPHPTGDGFGARDYPHTATSVGTQFRGCSHSITFGLLRLLGPQVAPTAATHAAGRPGLSHHASPDRLPGPGCGVATCSTRTISMAGLSPAGSQPCRLLPPALGTSVEPLFGPGMQDSRLR